MLLKTKYLLIQRFNCFHSDSSISLDDHSVFFVYQINRINELTCTFNWHHITSHHTTSLMITDKNKFSVKKNELSISVILTIFEIDNFNVLWNNQLNLMVKLNGSKQFRNSIDSQNSELNSVNVLLTHWIFQCELIAMEFRCINWSTESIELNWIELNWIELNWLKNKAEQAIFVTNQLDVIKIIN